jgi:hypothetical protein
MAGPYVIVMIAQIEIAQTCPRIALKNHNDFIKHAGRKLEQFYRHGQHHHRNHDGEKLLLEPVAHLFCCRLIRFSKNSSPPARPR